MSRTMSEFSTRMKKYEKEQDHKIDTSKYIVVRLDGHGFSKFTQWFTKPFDNRIISAMQNTAIDLVEAFNAVTAYVQSDEITLLLLPDDNMIFKWRTWKLLSLMAWFTSTRFNYWLNDAIVNEYAYDKDFLDKKVGIAYFDARIMELPNETEAFNMFLWRMKDCVKNSKNSFVQAYMPHKELQGLTSDELVVFCLDVTWKDWNNLSDEYKYGYLIKKENYINDEWFERTRITAIPWHNYGFNENDFNLVLCKRV